jgi:hypothetical protein
MIKILWLLKRKAGTTPEQFRERYERHSRLGQKLAGHLFKTYKRNYKIETWGGGTPTTHDGTGAFGPIEWEYDCIAEICFGDQAAFDETNQIFADPVLGKQFHEDEEDFLDRKSVIMFKCEEVDTGTGATSSHKG